MSGMPESPLDLSIPTHVHVIGVGGAGMSAIAEVLVSMGHTVSGSDLSKYIIPRKNCPNFFEKIF